MSFTFCSVDDLKNISIGQALKINARYEDLKCENGKKFGFVAKKDDVVVVQRIKGSKLIVCFIEDTVPLSTKNREVYGEFIVELNQIQRFD